MDDEATTVDIVRLPVVAGGEGTLLSLLRGHPYFHLDGLNGSRILVSSDEPEVVLVLDRADHGAPKRALASEPGRALRAGLEASLAGAPSIAYYGAPA